MLSGDDIRKLGMVLVAIPKEMFWAYESVRQSGHYNMAGIRFPFAEVNTEEMIRVMNEGYMEYIAAEKLYLQTLYEMCNK